jgi:hypothetical protein
VFIDSQTDVHGIATGRWYCLAFCSLVPNSKETKFNMTKCRRGFPRLFWLSLAAASFVAALGVFHAAAQSGAFFLPGNLVVSRTVYDNNPNNVTVGMTLPPQLHRRLRQRRRQRLLPVCLQQ